MTKPVDPFKWADQNPGGITDPGGKKNTGWVAGEKPPASVFNWIHNTVQRWLDYFTGWTDNHDHKGTGADGSCAKISTKTEIDWGQPGYIERQLGDGFMFSDGTNLDGIVADRVLTNSVAPPTGGVVNIWDSHGSGSQGSLKAKNIEFTGNIIGAPTVIAYARINNTGTASGKFNVNTSTKTGVGEYTIVLDSGVVAETVQVTIRGATPGSSRANLFVSGTPSITTIVVNTVDLTGSPTDYDFFLTAQGVQ